MKWKPSKSQARAFAVRMQNPDEKAEYEERKKQKAQKRRESSNFDYETAGGFYIPTKNQHDFAFNNIGCFDNEFDNAANMVIYGYTCQEKIDHDYIHIINEKIRNQAI